MYPPMGIGIEMLKNQLLVLVLENLQHYILVLVLVLENIRFQLFVLVLVLENFRF